MRIIDEEISHPSHPEHSLKLESKDEPFRCDGCLEPGVGARYACEACRFDMHKGCAVAPGTPLRHPLFKNSTFTFRHEPPSPSDHRICDACGKDVHGFVYHCDSSDLDLHPCCASLRLRFTENGHTFSLRKEASRRCSRCGVRGGFWFYRSECNNVYLHVACMKDMACESWEMNYLNSNNRQMQITNAPILEGVLQNCRRERAGSRFERFCKIVGAAVRIIIAAILGDPTVIIATAVGALLSKK